MNVKVHQMNAIIPRVHRRSSREAVAARGSESNRVATIADLIALVSITTDIANKKRIYLRCGLNRFADLCGLDPANVPADPVELRTLLARHIDRNEDITQSRARTIKASVGTALAIAGLGEGVRPRGARLEGEFIRLLNLAPSPWARLPLRRFFRYCSDHGVPLSDISQRTFDGYERYVLQRTLVPMPGRVTRLSRCAWNKAAQGIPSWPKVHWEERGRPRDPAIALAPSFMLELAAYRRYMQARGSCPGGQRKKTPYRSSTIRNFCQLACQFARILTKKLRKPACFAHLVEPGNAALILHVLRTESGARLKTIYHRAVFLRHLASTWCHADEATLSTLLELERKYIPRYRGRAERSYKLAKLLFDTKRRMQLLDLPYRLMDRAKSQSGQRTAIAAQIAAALEISLSAPLWPGNLARLEIGRTLRKHRDKLLYSIELPASEVHNATPLSYALPRNSSALLHRYINEFRPKLCTPEVKWLFPGRGNKPKQTAALSSQISNYIRRATRLDITVSSLRYLIGALYLLRNPESYEVVRQANGHRRLQSTQDMYRDLIAIRTATRFDRRVLSPSVAPR